MHTSVPNWFLFQKSSEDLNKTLKHKNITSRCNSVVRREAEWKCEYKKTTMPRNVWLLKCLTVLKCMHDLESICYPWICLFLNVTIDIMPKITSFAITYMYNVKVDINLKLQRDTQRPAHFSRDQRVWSNQNHFMLPDILFFLLSAHSTDICSRPCTSTTHFLYGTVPISSNLQWFFLSFMILISNLHTPPRKADLTLYARLHYITSVTGVPTSLEGDSTVTTSGWRTQGHISRSLQQVRPVNSAAGSGVGNEMQTSYLWTVNSEPLDFLQVPHLPISVPFICIHTHL